LGHGNEESTGDLNPFPFQRHEGETHSTRFITICLIIVGPFSDVETNTERRGALAATRKDAEWLRVRVLTGGLVKQRKERTRRRLGWDDGASYGDHPNGMGMDMTSTDPCRFRKLIQRESISRSGRERGIRK
jgi:hypothetical protein